MNKTLDLRFRGKIPSDLSEQFNTISYKLRSEFNDFMTTLSIPHKNNIDWWVEGPASRNTLASPLFHNFCCLYFIKHLIDEDEFLFDSVLVNMIAQKILIEKILEDHEVYNCNIIVEKIKFRTKLKSFFTVSILISFKVVQLIIARSSGKSNIEKLRKKQLVLIDTYMMPEYTSNDRWYGSFWRNIEDKIKQTTYFVPTLVMTPVSEMFMTYKALRNNERSFLIKEDFISVLDIIYAAQHRARVKKIKIPSISVLGYDFSDVIEEELFNNSDRLMPIESLLTVQFIKNINSKGLYVSTAIDWFEGQSIDKAWSYGFNRYYKNVPIIGYRPFESFPFYLCSYPIHIENESGILPDIMAVQGKGTVKTVKEFMPNLDVIVIPSFKSEHVWDCEYAVRNGKKVKILIALPISIVISKNIVKTMCRIINDKNITDKYIECIVKPHPTHNVNMIKGFYEDIAEDDFLITKEKSISNLLHKSDILVTEASSVCLESLACGVPVIIIENREGLTNDPTPKSISKDIVKKVRTDEGLKHAIQHFVGLEEHQKEKLLDIGRDVRRNYFEPILQENIMKIFNSNPYENT